MRPIHVLALLLTIVGPFALAACGGAASGKPLVVTSFYPLYYLTAQIAGDRAQIRNLVPAGAEPHDWEPKASDLVNIKQASVFVYNGAGFEAWVPKALDAAQSAKRVNVEATKGLPLASPPPGGESADFAADPHAWLDPSLAKALAAQIAAGLTQADPAGGETFAANLAALTAKLDALDGEYRAGLANCARREIFTSHAAFGYLATRYGLVQVPLEGLAPDAEPTPARLAEVTRRARDSGATTIYFETLVSPKVAETIAKEVGARTLTLDPLEGVRDERAQTYFTLMADNLANLRTGLDCR